MKTLLLKYSLSIFIIVFSISALLVIFSYQEVKADDGGPEPQPVSCKGIEVSRRTYDNKTEICYESYCEMDNGETWRQWGADYCKTEWTEEKIIEDHGKVEYLDHSTRGNFFDDIGLTSKDTERETVAATVEKREVTEISSGYGEEERYQQDYKVVDTYEGVCTKETTKERILFWTRTKQSYSNCQPIEPTKPEETPTEGVIVDGIPPGGNGGGSKCPPGYIWDANDQECELENECNDPRCPPGYLWDPNDQECERCEVSVPSQPSRSGNACNPPIWQGWPVDACWDENGTANCNKTPEVADWICQNLCNQPKAKDYNTAWIGGGTIYAPTGRVCPFCSFEFTSISCYTPSPTVDLSSAYETYNVGEQFHIWWTSSNATNCNASGSWSGNKPVNGQEIVGPFNRGNYTFTLTCSGPGGTASDSLNLKIIQVPQCVFTANPSSIILPETSTLSWNCSYADSCVIDQEIGSVNPNSGSLEVRPTSTTIYNLTCNGLDGSRSFEAKVGVSFNIRIREVIPRW